MKNTENVGNTIYKISPIWYLAAGVVAISASHMSFAIDLAGWVASVPFLLYLYTTQGWKSRLAFVGALIAAWSVVVLKIVTPPIPHIMVFLFSVPISLFHLPAYLIWDRFKHHKMAVVLFPAVFAVMEWIQYTFTPFASWGVAAYTQSHNPVMMQAVSISGMAGLSFLIYWINVSIVRLVATRKITLISFYIPVVILLLVVVYGSWRIDAGKSKGVETQKIAAVGTDSEVSGLPLPSPESNRRVIADLFERTRKASLGGAEIIVWNEASFFVMPEDEPGLMNDLKLLARELKISLVASYVVPVSMAPLKYRNKLLFIDAGGKAVFSYNKHQPVPGEPAVKGTEVMKVVNVSGSNVGGAICYDYDFPYLAREYGRLKADIVALPSSDWRGIDPLHTRMAAFRAIEQGHSIIRSTRFGLSAAITPYGEMISQMSSFDTNNRIMLSDLPAKGVKTLYAVIGDTFIYLCIAFAFAFMVYLRKPKTTYD